MNKIWANRLEAGTQIWANCPISRREAVIIILREDVANGKITEERFNEIIS